MADDDPGSVPKQDKNAAYRRIAELLKTDMTNRSISFTDNPNFKMDFNSALRRIEYLLNNNSF